MIDFRLLRHFWYFLAVAEEGHFGKAAQRLGMSQPPLSQQIQLLEKMLGVCLFERSRQGARLTREGAAILAPVRRFMEHAYRLQLTVEGLSIIAISYYALGILGYLFEGLHEVLPFTKGEMLAVSAPIVVFLVFLGIRRLRKGAH